MEIIQVEGGKYQILNHSKELMFQGTNVLTFKNE